MARTMVSLLVALTMGWCASAGGVAPAHYGQGARAITPAVVAPRPTKMSHAGLGRSAAAHVGRTRAGCPQTNQWLGLPYLNRYANGNCGYYIGGLTLPLLDPTGRPILTAFPTGAVTLYQEGGVEIKGSFTLSSGSTLIMSGDSRKMDIRYLDLAIEGRLVVQPGATLRVGGGSIRVTGTGASLQMQGTPSQPVVLTSARPNAAPGDWGFIELDQGTTGVLSYVHLSDAGGTRLYTGNGTYTAHAGIVVNGAAVTVTNSIIDHGAGNGIEVGGIVSEPVLDADQLLDNAGWAVHYDFVPRDLTKLTNLKASGPGLNVVGITPGAYGAASGTWHSPGLPLRIASDTPRSGPGDVGLGDPRATLTVAPGTTLQLDNGGAIFVTNGGLRMRGTARQPIVLTGDRPKPAPGDWGRIEFDAGTTGLLSHVHLSYAGATRLYAGNGTYTAHAGIVINGGAVTVTNSIVDHSAGNGIEINGASEPVLDADQLLDNAGWAVRYDFVPRDLTKLTNLRARGRGLNMVGITPGAYGAASGTWYSPSGLPLRIAANKPSFGAGDLYLGQSRATLTVAPGTTLQLERGNNIIVTNGGLRMRGTARQPIVLTSDRPKPAPGDWGRIEFDGGTTGLLSYVHLSYAGATRNFTGSGSATTQAGIVVNGAAVTITHSTIDHSSGHDVEAAGGARPVLHDNRFLAVRPGNFGVVNDAGATGAPIDATNNYWGDPSGPSGAAKGRGVPVSPGVRFRPWLRTPPAAR